MKKTLWLIALLSFLFLMTACDPFGPEPGPDPVTHKIDGTWTLTSPVGTLMLEDMSTAFPDVAVLIPTQGWDFDSGSFNYVSCRINNNTFEFHATKTYTNPQQTIDCTGFSVGAQTIAGTIHYNGASIAVQGTRQ
ncbi:MAG TPA: hypothetical protein P5107_07090 [Thermotogota bacterium]|nr:hypothetical protein [Thermotogota bacterium]